MYEPLHDEEEEDGRQYRKSVHKYKKTDSTTIQMHSSGVVYRRRKSDRWFKKHKAYIFAFAVLCVFFLLYQIITYLRFALDASDDVKSAYYERKGSKYSKDEMEYFKKHLTVYMPGVPTSEAHIYIKTGETFTCITSREVIPFSHINDNYCDCHDGTDEPSTSACPNNVFHCVEQTFDGKKTIPSSHVNDGICDCCEGSDEWQNMTIPLVFNSAQKTLLQNASKVLQTPCTNHCNPIH